MKVYSGKSNWTRNRKIRLPGPILLIFALTLSTANVQFANTTAPQQNPKETSSNLNRDAKKAMRRIRRNGHTAVFSGTS